ncbi:sensor histidine kinase [Belnapia sp. F-4-1]|uniref:sensor histidine kinase n=1 Tax=Belnapia sp. F-4-1 TaxID=1545443 RepID=UPI00068D2F85|nr:sensor histidine kinase [Belnapia sp. F-4-1]
MRPATSGGAVLVPLAAGPDGKSRGFLKIMRDRTEPRREEERRLVLLRELDHTVKNTLAVVQSVTIQSRRYAPTPADFQDALVARLAALARSHDLLTRSSWEGASLRDIVRQTLAPYATKVGQDRLSLQGPPVRLTPTAVVTLNLAFHELATNAAKYGALSAPGGGVEVGWHIDRTTKEKPQLEVHWRERGGPPVRVPASRGFGTRLIERGLSREFDAAVRLDFAPAGVECMIRLPFAPRLVSL